MQRFLAFGFATLLAAAGLAAGCGDDEPATTTTTTSSSTAASTGGGDSLYARLGGNAGIKGVIDLFVAKVVANPKINGYFLNSTVDAARLTDCLVKQIGEATGGPEKYDCKSMKEVHTGMGVSKADFDDLVADLVTVLTDAKVAKADIDTIASVLLPMEADIVESPKNDETIYQRIGRKPAVMTVIDKFVVRVVGDAEINGFFGSVNAGRLKSCLVRQVCGATGGPCKYGLEVDAETIEPGVSSKNVCKDMKTVHAGMKDNMNSPVTKADFDALAADLVKELKDAGVADADITAIVGVLTPMCPDIVGDPATCM